MGLLLLIIVLVLLFGGGGHYYNSGAYRTGGYSIAGILIVSQGVVYEPADLIE